MTEPSTPRPVPGPPRPGEDAPTTVEPASAAGPFADLVGQHIAEHVAVFEAEHARLERELGTIDQL